MVEKPVRSVAFEPDPEEARADTVEELVMLNMPTGVEACVDKVGVVTMVEFGNNTAVPGNVDVVVGQVVVLLLADGFNSELELGRLIIDEFCALELDFVW